MPARNHISQNRILITQPSRNMHTCETAALGNLRGRLYRPISEAVAQVIDNQKLIADGQQLVDMSLLSRDDDNEEWRQSLEDN